MNLESVSGGRYRLTPAGLNFSGTYELQSGELVIVEPLRADLLGFRWRRSGNDTLILIAQPDTNMGANYVGATLKREPAESPASR